MGNPITANFAAKTPPKLARAPIERSNSSTDMIKVAPIAITTNRDICRVILMKFDKVAKEVGLNILKIRIIATPANIVPYDFAMFDTCSFLIC